jgi:hypothetical protein
MNAIDVGLIMGFALAMLAIEIYLVFVVNRSGR